MKSKAVGGAQSWVQLLGSMGAGGILSHEDETARTVPRMKCNLSRGQGDMQDQPERGDGGSDMRQRDPHV